MTGAAYLRQLPRCHVLSCSSPAEVELILPDGRPMGRYCRGCGEAMLAAYVVAARHTPDPIVLTPEGPRRQGSGS